MNAIRQTQQLNRRELEAAIPPSASWHVDYRDTAWLYVGGFSFDLSEGDILTIFSQYGNPTHLNLIRDRETGKSKGFGFLKYEDQRSCDLAVDNLGGAKVLDRLIRVDHTRYKKKEGEEEETYRVDRLEAEAEDAEREGDGMDDVDDTDDERPVQRTREMLKEELELEKLLQADDGEEEDPMRQYLIDEKKAEVAKALSRRAKAEERSDRERKTKHNDDGEDKSSRPNRQRDGEEKLVRRRSRSGERRRKHDHREDAGRRKDQDAYRHRRRHSRSRSRSSSRERTRYRR